MAIPLEDYCVGEHATMQDAIAVIQKNRSRCAIVRSREGKVVGVFSEGDVLRALLRGSSVMAPLANLMRPTFVSLKSRDMLAAHEHFLRGLPLIPVLDEEFRLMDVITVTDALAAARP
jgi:CBS domain-containing protein